MSRSGRRGTAGVFDEVSWRGLVEGAVVVQATVEGGAGRGLRRAAGLAEVIRDCSGDSAVWG